MNGGLPDNSHTLPAMQTIKTDILIFGGGIAGLWLLNRLRAAGYSVLLLEQDRLGGSETLNANGIIHGGLKFGLSAMLRDVEALDDMPVRSSSGLAIPRSGSREAPVPTTVTSP